MRIAVFCDVFPELSETFIVSEAQALRRAGHEVQVVSLGHAKRPNWPAGEQPLFVSDLQRPEKVRALANVAVRHPAAVLRDVLDRRTWTPAERPRRLGALAPVVVRLERWGVQHVHVHFAAQAALEGLRVGCLLDVPVSITAHAYEIFMSPRNLAEKLRRAAFTTSGCKYNVEHLRGVAGPAHAGRVHEIVMGVDASAFARTRPHVSAGTVLAVGRLVEKKGFADLIEAAAGTDALERLTIVGEGPLEAALRAQAERLGLGERVEFAGARTPGQVRQMLETAAVFAMPCVVAADGDRDSMPVAVKEAMAMELPVVATREVGLPEVVDEQVGRLVEPRDPPALARALGELLAMSADERAELGRRGRARVKQAADVDRETAKLIELIEGARA